ncbi:unnamed protein product [Brassica oleracea]
MPLKSIARCSVSKRWAFVLRRPDFTELFFTRSLARTLLLLARIKEEEVIFFSTPQPQNLGIGNMTWRLIECDVPHSYPGTKSICINGVLYYNARDSNGDDMVVRFDVRSEKYSFVNFIERRMLPVTLINFQGKLASVRLSRCLRLVTSCVASVQSTIANGSAPAPVVVEREQIRLGLPIKGRMAADAIDLLKVCQLFVKQVNPRQEVKKYREVMRRLRDCARATFLEFKSAIASDVSSHPFPGGAVHPLTNYVMNYLMALTDFSQTLGSLLMEHEDVEDLTIPPSPPDAINPEEEEFTYDSPEKFVAMKRHFCSIASVLEANLQMKLKLYRDVSLRHIFLLNNIHYMTRKSWLRR